MDHRSTRLTLCALLALLALPLASPAQEDSGYKPVEAHYLADNLQKFWATGLAFLDTVTKPVSQAKQKVGSKTYLQFETKTLGTCYVDAALGERLTAIAPGQDLVFTATVLHRKRGFFSFGGGPQYYVAVINIQPALGSVKGLPDQVSGFALPTNSPDARVLANVDELLKGLQTEIAILARERGIPAWELMTPGSTNRTDVELVVTRGVNALADAMSVEPHDVLGQMLLAMMAARVQPDQPALVAPKPAPVAAATEPPPPAEPADIVVTKPAREPQMEKSADPNAGSAVVDTAVEMAGANPALAVAEPAPAAAGTKEEQARLARAKADEEKRARAEAEKAAEAKAEQEKLAKAEQKRMAREKAAQEEAAQEAAAKAAAEKAAQEKKARAEQQRLERDRLAAEKKAAAEQARLAEEQAEREAEARAAQAKAEKKRLAEEQKVREEAARNAAKAAAEAPKLRASTTVDAATGTVIAEPKSAQPSAKLQPKPTEQPASKPAPPAAGEDDPNAPVPL